MIKRYDIMIHPLMEKADYIIKTESEDGEWVKYSDLEQVLKENERLRERIKELEHLFNNHITEIDEQNERIKNLEENLEAMEKKYLWIRDKREKGIL